VIPQGWEGNRRSAVALAMRHRLKWFIHLRVQRPRVGDEHPAYAPAGASLPLPFLHCTNSTESTDPQNENHRMKTHRQMCWLVVDAYSDAWRKLILLVAACFQQTESQLHLYVSVSNNTHVLIKLLKQDESRIMFATNVEDLNRSLQLINQHLYVDSIWPFAVAATTRVLATN